MRFSAVMLVAGLMGVVCSSFAIAQTHELADDFTVDGATRMVGDDLVGTTVPGSDVKWVGSAAYNNASFVFINADDMVVNGQVRIDEGGKAVANGIDVPAMSSDDALTVEFQITLNNAPFGGIMVSADWDMFWRDAAIFQASIAKNGNVQVTYPGGKIARAKNNRPWWLRKDQPILICLLYNAKANTLSVAMRGHSTAPDDPQRPDVVVLAQDVAVPADLYKRIATAGMFVSGDSARMDNFRLKVQPADQANLDLGPVPAVVGKKPASASSTPSVAGGQTVSNDITITVADEPRQTFEGFGANIMGGPRFNRLTSEQHAQLAKLIWTDLKFNTIRLWFYTWNRRENRAPDYDDHKDRYISNQVLEQAKKAGMSDILLTADGFPPQWTEKDAKGRDVIVKEHLKDYANAVADVVAKTREQDGIMMEYVGLQNEPGAHDPFRPEDFPTAIKAMRKALDEHGLSDVKIVAPETADAGPAFFKTLELIQADPEAWAALDVIAAHSYAKAADARAAQIAEASGKSFWMTEASNAPPDDVRAAANNIGLCLNDLNHHVNRWMWFIGYANYSTSGDRNGPRLVAYKIDPFEVHIPQKYFYFQALSQTFDVDGVFYQTTSSLDGDMTWPNKQSAPPRITAAAARNPDGSWGIAILNYTVGPDTPPDINAMWPWPRRPGFPQQTFNVTVKIDALEGESIPFSVHRCNENLSNADQEAVMAKNGEIAIEVKPMELVVLRSRSGG